jgi:hypothetical protein
MPEPAYLSDELDLTDAEKAAAENLGRTPGTELPTTTALLKLIQKHGKAAETDGILDVALLLPLEDYEKVRDAYKRAPDNHYRPIVRRKR